MDDTGSRIKKALEINGMKQADLVERTGINKGALSSYISNKYKPKQDNIYKLAEALNVSEPWLIGLDVPMERIKSINKKEITKREEALLSNFNKLNTTGKDEAIKRVAELTEINKYTSKEDKDYLIPCAAHNKEGAEGNIQHDIDLMKDDELWK